MNGRKLVAPNAVRCSHGVEDDAAARRHARADRAPRLAAERDVDVPRDHAGVGSGDDVPGERAAELVVDPTGRARRPTGRRPGGRPGGRRTLRQRAPDRTTGRRATDRRPAARERPVPSQGPPRPREGEARGDEQKHRADAGECSRHLALLAPSCRLCCRDRGRRCSSRSAVGAAAYRPPVIRATSRSVRVSGATVTRSLSPFWSGTSTTASRVPSATVLTGTPSFFARVAAASGVRSPDVCSPSESSSTVAGGDTLRRLLPGAQRRAAQLQPSDRSRHRVPSRRRAGSGRGRSWPRRGRSSAAGRARRASRRTRGRWSTRGARRRGRRGRRRAQPRAATAARRWRPSIATCRSRG